MTSLLARAFQISKLTKSRIIKLHEIELRNGDLFVPYEIKRRGDLPDTGSISDGRLNKLESAVWAIFHKIDRDEPDLNDIELTHLWDFEILNSTLDFSPERNSGGLLNRVKSAKNTEEIPEYGQSPY